VTEMPRVPVSWGELIDKITILEIKVELLRSPQAVANARRELALLQAVWGQGDSVDVLKDELAAVNRTLWDVEDALRSKEAAGVFDTEFVELARSVYHNNDKRSRIKRAINERLQSVIIEEKQYVRYGDTA
jgi:Family of unknown function (DUF6165)